VSALAEKLTLVDFRRRYAGAKPYFELLNGEAVQKSPPTRLHSILQTVLERELKKLGFKARPELTLHISNEWEPIPDVSGILGPEEDPYPTRAIAVAVEVLSPEDRFTAVIGKCRQYAQWGIQDVLVFDPVERQAWFWDREPGDLRSFQTDYRFRSNESVLSLAAVWHSMEDEINS
jgi:Uma2 family endonuclease